MIKNNIIWKRNIIGVLESYNIPRLNINISGNLSSSIPPHRYWIYASDNKTKLNFHDSRVTEEECKQLAQDWWNNIDDGDDLYTWDDYDKEE